MSVCRVYSPTHILPLYGDRCALHLAAERCGLDERDVRLPHLQALERPRQIGLFDEEAA